LSCLFPSTRHLLQRPAGAILLAPALALALSGSRAALAGQAKPLDTAAPVRVKVELEGVSGAQARNVRAVLSIARAEKEKDLTLAHIRQLDRRARSEIETALEPFGFYQPVVVSTLRQNGRTWVAHYTIAPGPAVRVRQVDIQMSGDGADAPIFRKAVTDFPLHQGDTLRHLPYEAWKLAVLTAASDSGYLQATFDTTALTINRAEAIGDVLVRFSTGPRFRFGPVTFNQTVLDSSFLATRIPFRRGRPFQQQQLLQLQQNLGEDPYFSMVEIIPHPDSAVNLEVPIEVDLSARKPEAYEVGLGYATDNGARGRLTTTFRRINRRGHYAEAELIGSLTEQSISTRYNIPAFGHPTGVLTLLAGYAIQNPSISRTTTFLVGPRLARRRFGWRETFLLNYQRSSFGIGVDSGVAKMLLAGANYERSRSDSRIYPTSGLRTRLDLQGSSRSLASNVSFLELHASAKAIKALGPRLRVIVRAEGGRVLTNEFRQLPPTARFFAGGDQSVRGYQYLTLGEHDSLGNVIGGRSIITGSAEADFRFLSRFALALFVDTGNAMERFSFSELKQGAGAGIRWISPVGLIRVDGAFALSLPGTPFRLHLSLGPDL
jgi:translocation and assembly module TamA